MIPRLSRKPLAAAAACFILSACSKAPPSPLGGGASITNSAANIELLRPDCVLSGLPADFILYGVGGYSAWKKLDVDLGMSGTPPGKVTVVVTEESRPVVLLLTAYEPTVWQVGRSGNAVIAGVIVNGYEKQVLLGVDKSVPQVVSSYEEGEKEQTSACPYFRLPTGSSDSYPFKLLSLFRAGLCINPDSLNNDDMCADDMRRSILTANEYVKAMTGRYIDAAAVQETLDELVTVGPETSQKASYAGELDLGPYLAHRAVRSGQKGLQQLLDQGALRKAAPEDIAQWKQAAARGEACPRTFNSSVLDELERSETYVVLKNIELPAGLFGSLAVNFIVPQHLELPQGDPGHCSFFLHGARFNQCCVTDCSSAQGPNED